MEPTAEEVRRQLDRILASDLFANADRLSRFLRFVVERTLAGEGDQLKDTRLASACSTAVSSTIRASTRSSE